MHDHIHEQPIDDWTMLCVRILDSGHQSVVLRIRHAGLTAVGPGQALIDIAVWMPIDNPGEDAAKISGEGDTAYSRYRIL